VENEKKLGFMGHDSLLEYKYKTPKTQNVEKFNSIKMSDYNGKNATEIKITRTDYVFKLKHKIIETNIVNEYDFSEEWRAYVRTLLEKQEKDISSEFTFIGKFIRNITGKTLPKEYDKNCKKYDKEQLTNEQQEGLSV
jgi:hypothetical protein